MAIEGSHPVILKDQAGQVAGDVGRVEVDAIANPHPGGDPGSRLRLRGALPAVPHHRRTVRDSPRVGGRTAGTRDAFDRYRAAFGLIATAYLWSPARARGPIELRVPPMAHPGRCLGHLRDRL
jgi:hypothetical protein